MSRGRLMGKFDAELIATAQAISEPGRGILAADESTGTIGKRFSAINLENNQDNRRRYRELLFRTKGLGEYISGAILFEETLFDHTVDGKGKLVDLLLAEGIVPGIKVDKGQQALSGGAEGETSTDGIDGLGKRCAEYYAAGARFAKWRAVIKIDPKTGAPSELAIQEQTRGLARYASICQANGLVPIVEPEVLMDGEHPIQVSADVTSRVWAAQIKALADHQLLLEGLLLKPNMVRAGMQCPTPASMQEVARWTVKVLSNTIPPAIPGINFLSGGMSEEDATVALNELNKIKQDVMANTKLSFSYGRALQKTVIAVWKGKDEYGPAAQNALMVRAKANSMASKGIYDGSAANFSETAKSSSYVKNYSY